MSLVGLSPDRAIHLTSCPTCGAAATEPCERVRQAPSTPLRTHQTRIQQAGRLVGCASSIPTTPLTTRRVEAAVEDPHRRGGEAQPTRPPFGEHGGRRCYHCGEADFELHTFLDLGGRVGVLCPNCGEYAYGSNGFMAVLHGASGFRFDLEALVEILQKESGVA